MFPVLFPSGQYPGDLAERQRLENGRRTPVADDDPGLLHVFHKFPVRQKRYRLNTRVQKMGWCMTILEYDFLFPYPYVGYVFNECRHALEREKRGADRYKDHTGL